MRSFTQHIEDVKATHGVHGCERPEAQEWSQNPERQQVVLWEIDSD
ncbi:MAG: hypothetical protein AAFX87_11730 [Bacteroidota bacterium]